MAPYPRASARRGSRPYGQEFYAIPALAGAAVVVGASEAGTHGLAFPIVGAAVCFAIRPAGIHYGVNVPTARQRP
jgi:uncharacterized membrane protein YeiH